jgi:cell volume regulation protein A
MVHFLLLAAAVMLASVLFSKLSSRLGVPSLLAFILLGMLLGSDGPVKIQFDNYSLAEQVGSVALVFVMFYGGFGTNWTEARPVAVKAGLLSSVGTLLTAGLTGTFCWLALRMQPLESYLLGAIVSSTDAASVFSILRSRRLNLKYNTASLLEIESGSNDPFAYMLTAILLTVMSAGASPWSFAYAVFAQLVYGAAFGVLIALASIWFLRRFRFPAEGLRAVFMVTAMLLSYAAPPALGGNGFLSAYIAGILLGNAEIPQKRTLVHFFDGATAIMQMLLFFTLGLLSFPSRLAAVAPLALLIALFLTFVARPAAVFALLTPFGCKPRQQLLVSWAGMRGAASIVFAIMAYVSPRPRSTTCSTSCF